MGLTRHVQFFTKACNLDLKGVEHRGVSAARFDIGHAARQFFEQLRQLVR